MKRRERAVSVVGDAEPPRPPGFRAEDDRYFLATHDAVVRVVRRYEVIWREGQSWEL